MRAAEQLTDRVAAELSGPTPEAARILCDAILARHGDGVAAILFYGSCLRKDTHEGVLDFYVVVDDYRSAYESLYLRLVNSLVPPNVFYREIDSALGPIRCKYAVISRQDFERGTSSRSPHPYIWARFAQPARIVHARDDESRDFVARRVGRAIVTLVRRLVVFLPAQRGSQRFSPAALWQEAFRRTYGSELRTEGPETVRANFEAAPERYAEVTSLALFILQEEEFLATATARGQAFEIEMPAARRWWGRVRWNAERPLCKILAFVRRLKTTTTFGDWVPYIVWKLERHTGKRLELTPRQERHPFVYGWPVLARLLWRREIF